MFLNLRKRTILETIVNKKVDLYDLSDLLNVSTRTVRRDLILISSILLEYGFVLEKNQYYYIKGDMDVLKKILAENNIVEYNLNERQIFIVAQILEKYFSRTNDIAQDLFISEKNIIDDISNINSNFSTPVILVVKKEITLLNDEVLLRKMLFMIMMEFITPDKQKNIAETLEINENIYKNLHEQISQIMDVNDFKEIAYLVEESFTEKNKYISDLELIEITIGILIAKKRITKFKFVNNLFEKCVTNSLIEKNIVDKLKIQNEFENSFLLNFISGYTIDLEFKNINSNTTKKIIKFLKIINENLNIDFINRNEVQINVYNHIVRNVDKKRSTMLISDHPFVELTREYEFILKIIKNANIESNMDFNEVEMAEILIYYVLQLEKDIVNIRWKILVVCMGGMGTSLMLKNMIQLIFRNSTIDNIALSSASKSSLMNYDIIITTNSFARELEAIEVTPFLTQDDLRKIKVKLVQIRLNNDDIKIPHHNLEENNIEIKSLDCNNLDKNNTISYLLDRLEEESFINNKQYLYEKILLKETYGVIIPDEEIGMYHIMSSSVIKPVIFIAKCDNYETLGINMKYQSAKHILLILVPNNCSNKITMQLNHLSTLLISNYTVINAIKSSNIEIINDYLM